MVYVKTCRSLSGFGGRWLCIFNRPWVKIVTPQRSCDCGFLGSWKVISVSLLLVVGVCQCCTEELIYASYFLFFFVNSVKAVRGGDLK